MSANSYILLVFSFIALLIIRGYIGAVFRLCLSKKERKTYIRENSFIKRWFLLNTTLVKDKYSKREKRIIKHTTIIQTYRTFNIIIHILFLLLLVFTMLYASKRINAEIINHMYIVYFCVCLLVIILFAIVDLLTNRNYHRSRYK